MEYHFDPRATRNKDLTLCGISLNWSLFIWVRGNFFRHEVDVVFIWGIHKQFWWIFMRIRAVCGGHTWSILYTFSNITLFWNTPISIYIIPAYTYSNIHQCNTQIFKYNINSAYPMFKYLYAGMMYIEIGVFQNRVILETVYKIVHVCPPHTARSHGLLDSLYFWSRSQKTKMEIFVTNSS